MSKPRRKESTSEEWCLRPLRRIVPLLAVLVVSLTLTAAASANASFTFAGTGEQHESTLVITKSGNGRINYADLARCPSCSFGSAPRGTLNFVLRSITKGRGTGHVTTTSDSKLYTKGESVRVRLAAASPSEFLVLSIGRNELTYFCNRAAAGSVAPDARLPHLRAEK